MHSTSSSRRQYCMPFALSLTVSTYKLQVLPSNSQNVSKKISKDILSGERGVRYSLGAGLGESTYWVLW